MSGDEDASQNFISKLKTGLKEDMEGDNWGDFAIAVLHIFIGVLIYGFVGANLTSILCWPTAAFDKAFPTNLNKPPYMGDPPSGENFWSDKMSKGMENCDLEEIGEALWPMENISFPYTWNRPSEEMMNMGMEWYSTWICKYFGMGAAYSWSSARWCLRWVLLLFKAFPTLMNNTAIPFYIMPYMFYMFATGMLPVVFGYVTTWIGYVMSPVEMGYLLWLSPWVSAFNAWMCLLAGLNGMWAGASMPLILFAWSNILTFMEYGWAILQGKLQYITFMIFCFTGGLFKNGGLAKISSLMWSHRKGLLIIFMFYSWAASTGFLNTNTVLGVFIGFIICTILLLFEKPSDGSSGITVPVGKDGTLQT